MSKLTVTREEHRIAIDMFLADHVHLARWAMARFPVAAEKHAIVALAFGPDCDWSWRKLASWTLTELTWLERERALTPTEQRLRSIAERIYDTSVAVGTRLDIDVFPEEKDRNAARRALDEAYERAIATTNPKGVVQ